MPFWVGASLAWAAAIAGIALLVVLYRTHGHHSSPQEPGDEPDVSVVSWLVDLFRHGPTH